MLAVIASMSSLMSGMIYAGGLGISSRQETCRGRSALAKESRILFCIRVEIRSAMAWHVGEGLDAVKSLEEHGADVASLMKRNPCSTAQSTVVGEVS